jgi:hypothetical protein
MSLESLESKERVFRGEVKEIRSVASGRFAVTEVPDTGKVTFSLNCNVWDGEDDPVTGEEVLLNKLRLVRGKWRALQANRIRP